MPIITASPKKYDHISLTPPEGVRKAAKRGLELRREFGRGGTAVGVARARDLSNGKSISPDTAKRMKAYFDRHQPDQKAEGFDSGEKGYPSAGRVAWLLWGGDAGYSWAKKVVMQMEAADKKVSAALSPTDIRVYTHHDGDYTDTQVVVEAVDDIIGHMDVFRDVEHLNEFLKPRDGVSFTNLPSGRLGYIGGIELPNSQRGVGLGRKALLLLEKEAAALGLKGIALLSTQEAAGFWKKMGFHESQADSDFYYFNTPMFKYIGKASDSSEEDRVNKKPSMAHVVLALHMAADALAGDTGEVEASLATALGLAVGLGLGGQTPTTPSYSNETTTEWTANSLEPELQPIAYLESKNNHGLTHKAHSKGEWDTAYGALGMKPSSGYDQYQKSSSLKSDYPGLDEQSFDSLFREDTDFYNAVANDHWLGLISKLGTPERAAFAWRFGRGAALNATDEEIKAAPYVKAYMRLLGESSSS